MYIYREREPVCVLVYYGPYVCVISIYSPYISVYVYSKDGLGSHNLLAPPPQNRPAPPYMVLGIKSMAFCTLGKQSMSELHPQPFCSWHVWCMCTCVYGYMCCVSVCLCTYI